MARYRIRARDMSRGLRLTGCAYRAVRPFSNERIFRRQNRMLDKWLTGHWISRQTTGEPVICFRPDGSELRMLICRSKRSHESSERVTGLLWIHGGGFAIGAPEQDFLFINGFCGDGDCVAVLPDYRRSTEAPYPAALDDCYLALQWMASHADELGVDVHRLFVGGDSAGGGLTAALCLLARDRGEVRIAFQMPLYPMLDDREETESSRENDAPVWNTKSNREGWRLYLGAAVGSDNVPAYAAPARAQDLRGLPPACTFVGTIDPFHDETVRFFERLRDAGVPVYIKEFPGCFHGFDLLAYRSAPAREARSFTLETFRYAKAHYRTHGLEEEDV